MGPATSTKSTPVLSEARDKFLTAITRKRAPRAAYSHALWRALHSSDAFASLGLESCQPLVGLFKSSSAAFQIEMAR
jgi:hypothetical protein